MTLTRTNSNNQLCDQNEFFMERRNTVACLRQYGSSSNLHENNSLNKSFEYDLGWDGGQLGISLTKRDDSVRGAQVSRVTGKGIPSGLKNVQNGDLLIAINDDDVTQLSVKQIIKKLRNCNLPATLRFQNTQSFYEPETELNSNQDSQQHHKTAFFHMNSHSMDGLDEEEDSYYNYNGRDALVELSMQPMSILHKAAMKGDLAEVLLCIREGKPRDIIAREDTQGQTPLHLAVRYGHFDVAEALCDRYVPVERLLNIVDKRGNTALHFAVRKHRELVDLLLGCKASTEYRNSQGMTPLTVSVTMATRDDNRIVKMLLDHGAEPNSIHNGQPLLHIAVHNKFFKIAGTLIHAGAVMDTCDGNGNTIFDKINRKITRYLINHIYYAPTWISTKERKNCMICSSKFKFTSRKYNCTHCGRVACTDCCSLSIELYKLPQGFPGRITGGAKAVHKKMRVCKTCWNVLRIRHEDKDTTYSSSTSTSVKKSAFVSRVLGTEWNEVNPKKNLPIMEAGKRID